MTTKTLLDRAVEARTRLEMTSWSSLDERCLAKAVLVLLDIEIRSLERQEREELTEMTPDTAEPFVYGGTVCAANPEHEGAK